MSTRIITLTFDANDPLRLARFWAATLRWDLEDETDDEIGLVPTDGTRFSLLFIPVPEPKTAYVAAGVPHTFHTIEEELELLVIFAPAEYARRASD